MFCKLIKEVVPERKEEIDELIIKHSLNFKAVEDSPEIRFCVRSTGEITINTQALERFWAHTYAYYALYECKQNGWQNEIDFKNNNLATEAATLLEWAVALDTQTLDTRKCLYPDVSIKPFEVVEDDSLSVCARDITLFGLGYILLHEIAHLEQQHSVDLNNDRATAIQQEYEADMWAAHFVMDKIDVYLNENYSGDTNAEKIVRIKRMLLITCCSNWLVKTECYAGISQSKTHPPMFERLGKIIDEFVSDDNDLSWGMTALVLSWHIQQSHPELIGGQKFDTYKERAQFYMDCISRDFDEM
jgi:hypothetical protein